ncbi:PKD domain-containing protein, partial [Luteibaculum oceani]
MRFSFLIGLFICLQISGQEIEGRQFILPLFAPSAPSGLSNSFFIESAYCIDSVEWSIPSLKIKGYVKVEPGIRTEVKVPNFINGNGSFNKPISLPNQSKKDNKAIHFNSPKPIVISQVGAYDGYGLRAFPISSLGNSYHLGGISNSINCENRNISEGNLIGYVVASQDSTDIRIDYTSNGQASNYKLTLNKGEVFYWKNVSNCKDLYGFKDLNCKTLAENHISSSKPIVAGIYGDLILNIGNSGGSELTCAQLLPINFWGTKYLFNQGFSRDSVINPERICNTPDVKNNNNFIQIVGYCNDSILITYSDSIIKTIIPGNPNCVSGFSSFLIELPNNLPQWGQPSPITIISKKPIQVISLSKSFNQDQIVDHEISLLLPSSTWSNTSFFSPIRFESSIKSSLALIYIEGNTMDDKISLNGKPLNNFPKYQNQLSDFTVYKYNSNLNSKGIKITNNTSKQIYTEYHFELNAFKPKSVSFEGALSLDTIPSLCDQCAEIEIRGPSNLCSGDTLRPSVDLLTFLEPEDLSYFWDFGDGTSSTLKNPKHLYAQAGTYTITLRIQSGNACFLFAEKQVQVEHIAINLSFPDSVCSPSDILVQHPMQSALDSVQVQYYSSDPFPLSIPDLGVPENWDGTLASADSALVSTINIAPSYPVPGNIDSVCVNLKHPYIEDVKLFLISPQNIVYPLLTNPNSNGRANLRKTCFSASASTPIQNAKAPYTGAFLPEGGSFPSGGIGSSVSGDWKLTVGDRTSLYTGQLLNWSIYVSSANFVDYSWSNNTNLISPPNSQGESVIRVTEQDTFLLTSTSLAGCSRVDTIAPFVGRNPVPLSHRDTLLCNIYKDFDLNQLITDSLKLSGGVWTILGGNPANLSGSLFDNRGIPAGDYQFLYTQDIFCGKDSALVNVTVTELPFLGQNAIDTLCDTENPLDLFPYLGNDVTSGGFWTNYDGVPEAAFAINTGIVDPRFVPEGNYFFYYKVPVAGCPADSSNVNLQIHHQPDAGSNGDTIICESGIPLTLLTVLNDNPETGGTWTDLDNSGGLDGQLFRGIDTPNNPNEQTFTFDYTIKGKKACIDSSALATVRVIAAPELTFSADFPILCKDSAVTITATMVGNGPFDLEISDGNGNTYPALNELPVINSYQFSQPLSDITTFSVTRMIDNSSLRCPIVKPAAIEVGVFEPIVAKLIEEDCILNPDGISFLGFTPVIELSGGDGTNYQYDLFVDGNLVKSGASAPSAVHRLDTLPNGVEYSYRFYDGSNCPDVEAVFNRRPRKYCECATFAGTMDINPLEFCEYETAVVPNVSNSFLEPEDTLYYILHDRAGIVLGERLDSNQFPSFDYFPALEFNKTYYISPIAGDRLGGGIDPIDTCVSVGDGTPIIFRPQPAVSFSSLGGDICEGDIFELGFEFTGNGPFRLQGTATNSKGTSVLDYSFLPDSGSLPLNPLENTVYRFTRLSDGNANTCELNFDTPIAVNVFDLPRVSITDPDEINICEGSSTQINVAITGGTGPYRIEFLKNGTPFGNPVVTNNNSFQLNVFEGGLYQINAIRDEGANCGGLVLDGSVRVVVKKQPFANAGPSPIEVCGSFTQLDATPSFGKGAWRLPSDGSFTFSNNKQSKTFAFVPEPGEYQFIWEETNAPCPV